LSEKFVGISIECPGGITLKQFNMAKKTTPKPAAPPNPMYPSKTGKDSGKKRGNEPKKKGK
jgi:hypothetical protein